jgi:hypothetical protein
MRQLIKVFLWIGCLALGLPSARAFSLLGPEANGGDAWQITANGFDPLVNGGAPPFLLDSLSAGPKNLGQGYRRTTPVIYYTFDSSFGSYFGSNGEFAVQQAFDILNGLTNVDRYSSGLTEFPLNSQSENYQANALGLVDLKSTTLSLLMEQLGLADAVRYTWLLHDRLTIAGCTIPCPACMQYLVAMRNFDIFPTPLDQSQYSAYVNNELYTYFIDEICAAPVAPPNADALELPADPLQKNYPVASGNGEGSLLPGFFYSGLTRDDVAGLRWLYSTNNFDSSSSGFRESAAPGSLLFSTNFNAPQLLFTSNYNALVSASLTNSPAALQLLFPGLIVNPNPPTYFSNVVSLNISAYFTNFVGQPAGQPATLVTVTTYVTNIVQFYLNSFGNVVTNKSYPNTTYAIQTITVGPPVGWPAGTPFVTNVTYQQFQSNVVSGDYFIITNGACGPNFIQTLQTNVSIVTNTIVGVTNVNGQMFAQNLISYFTNYAFVVQPCSLVTNALGDYQGLGRMQFVRVRDDDYDYQNGQFIQPITNQYTMVVITNGQAVTQTFQRVLTNPDLVFGTADLASGPNGGNAVGEFRRSVNFNQANILPGNAGPGTIDPGSSNQIVFNNSGPVFYNVSTPSFLSGPNSAFSAFFVWGSFDGTTNAPVVYPNGTSLANLAASALVQISPPPPTLPNGTNGVPYNVQLTATNTIGSLKWTLAPGSAGLPPGSPNLTLSPGGLISGIPTKSATYVNIVIQMMDSSVPPRTLQMVYSLTIN